MERVVLQASDGVSIAGRVYPPAGAAEALVGLYENAPREIRRIAPAELALRRISHFGPFRSEHETRLWPRMAEWLRNLDSPAAA